MSSAEPAVRLAKAVVHRRGCAQAVEHYEISRYGTLRNWAQELGLAQAASLLEMTLGEEERTDKTLTQLAETCVNQEAQSLA